MDGRARGGNKARVVAFGGGPGLHDAGRSDCARVGAKLVKGDVDGVADSAILERAEVPEVEVDRVVVVCQISVDEFGEGERELDSLAKGRVEVCGEEGGRSDVAKAKVFGADVQVREDEAGGGGVARVDRDVGEGAELAEEAQAVAILYEEEVAIERVVVEGKGAVVER